MDAPGNGHRKALHFHHIPRRVVSLVPSLTESLFDLGLGSVVVGITDYCVHPADNLTGLPRLGGTKNPRIEEITALTPDLVLANWEENTRNTVEALEACDIPVWVTFPKTVREAVDILWTLAGIFHNRWAALRLETLETAIEWNKTAAEEKAPKRYFCPIWYEESKELPAWWMTFNQETYCSDLLDSMGGGNIFASRVRRYPLQADLGLVDAQPAGEKDVRYPRVTLDEVVDGDPEIVFLPGEPYSFTSEHQKQLTTLLADTTAGQQGQIHLVDGSLITWHGTRLARALQVLPQLF